MRVSAVRTLQLLHFIGLSYLGNDFACALSAEIPT